MGIPRVAVNDIGVDTRGIELATKKNQSQSLSTSIRIITTGATLARATRMLDTIKAK